MRAFIIALLNVGLVLAQDRQPSLTSAIADVRYPPLAEAARVQGDVYLSVRAGTVSVKSGSPLLVRTAVESAKALIPVLGEADVTLKFHFAIVDDTTIVSTPMIVKKGDAFDRAILRIFGLKTERVVIDSRCEDSARRPNELKIAGTMIEIRVYGRSHCVQTQMGTLIARR
jgi:hypothetical protein